MSLVAMLPFAQRAWRPRSGFTGWSRQRPCSSPSTSLFLALTPARYRKIGCRKWPGALLDHRLVAGDGRTPARALGLFGGYSLTYGSLAGVMVALIFFFVVGLGVVIGAELNAALAESGPRR